MWCYNFESTTAAGTVYTYQRADTKFSGYSLVTFSKTKAGGGGAVVFSESNVIIEEHSAVIFNNNIAHFLFGGAFTCSSNSTVATKGT